VKTVGYLESDMASLLEWKRTEIEAFEADYLRTEGDILRHILYLCVMSAFLGLGARS
jgi:hypothetical protein